jgi:hypothetical protein
MFGIGGNSTRLRNILLFKELTLEFSFFPAACDFNPSGRPLPEVSDEGSAINSFGRDN